MRQVTRKGLMTVAAATGVLAGMGGVAHADSGAYGSGSGSPGVLSGNSVSAPVHVPVNVCGNTVDVIGVLNPSMGNSCVNESDSGPSDGGSGDGSSDGGSSGGGGSHAGGETGGSPGVGSGNNVQVPIDVPVNVCGNSVDVVGALNPSTGNNCENGSDGPATPPGGQETPPSLGEPDEPGSPEEPGTPDTPDANEPGPQTVTQPKGIDQLAQTGAGLPIGVALPVSAGAVLAGTVLYRRSRASA